jgi:hypothetical protein
MSGGDGMDSSTQVPVVRRACALAVTSYHVRHVMSSFPKVLALVVPALYQMPQLKWMGTRDHPGSGEETERDDRW